MRIFDCFMFYDEEMLLDIRLNILNKFIDQFIIVESTFSHSGKKRELIFDIEKYKKFKNKIKYFVVDKKPSEIETINSYKIESHSDRQNIGIWVYQNNKKKKVAAIGIKLKKWIAYHGFSINIDNDLKPYSKILPCGISEDKITTLKNCKKQNYRLNLKYP